MKWQEEQAGELNKNPLVVEVADAVYDELVELGADIDKDNAGEIGVITGITIRTTYRIMLKRGLLNDAGVAIVKAELQLLEAEEQSDHKH